MTRGDVNEASFDGMVELWFDDLDALLRARASAAWLASTEDERHFIDHSRTAYFISEERTLLSSRGLFPGAHDDED